MQDVYTTSTSPTRSQPISTRKAQLPRRQLRDTQQEDLQALQEAINTVTRISTQAIDELSMPTAPSAPIAGGMLWGVTCAEQARRCVGPSPIHTTQSRTGRGGRQWSFDRILALGTHPIQGRTADPQAIGTRKTTTSVRQRSSVNTSWTAVDVMSSEQPLPRDAGQTDVQRSLRGEGRGEQDAAEAGDPAGLSVPMLRYRAESRPASIVTIPAGQRL